MQEFLRVLKHKHVALLDKVVNFLLAFAGPLPFFTLLENNHKVLSRRSVEIAVKIERFSDTAEVIRSIVDDTLRGLVKFMKAVLGRFNLIALLFKVLLCTRPLL